VTLLQDCELAERLAGIRDGMESPRQKDPIPFMLLVKEYNIGCFLDRPPIEWDRDLSVSLLDRTEQHYLHSLVGMPRCRQRCVG
jgi:hypothetical protein